MKIKGSIQINKPQETVAKLFADPNNLKEYQDGFIKKELISGTAGENAAVSKMYYQQGKGEMILTETITNNALPDLFEAHYHHKHMDNTMVCTFTSVSEDQTEYAYEVEYTEFRGFVVKTMALLFPGIFKKQIDKWMIQFKVFAEKQ